MRSRLLACALFALGACSRASAEDAPRLSQLAAVEPAPSASTQVAPSVLLGPRVNLSGVARAEALRGESFLYARSPRVWIYAEPRLSATKLGYVRAGSKLSVRGRAERGDGCSEGFVPVEPRGYACRSALADTADDPVVLAARGGPSFESKLPFLYGTVRKPGPVYGRLPSREESLQSEPELEARMESWLRAGGEIGAAYGQKLWLRPGEALVDPEQAFREKRTEALPDFLSTDRNMPRFDERTRASSLVLGQMRPRAGYSFLRTFLWEGRRFGLTTDLTLAPTDRFRPIQGSDFHGVEIGKDIELPFAFVRSPEAHLYRLDRKRNALVDAGAADYRSVHRLTGKQQFFRGRLHYETVDESWLSDAHASRIDAAKRMPAWGKNGEHWLDINLSKQTLVAYDGIKPVYATLISSGEAGLEDPAHSTATKRGIFRIHTKHVSTSMSSDEAGEEFELRDVPYVQYFEDGYALHGAYWHDRFGTPKSHGCINLAPEDARRLFSFTEPQLPEGWHAVLMPLRGSVVFVHP